VAFKVGSFLLLAAGIGASADAYAVGTSPFWTNDLMLTSIGLALVSVACFIKAFWASSLRPGRVETFPDVTVEVRGVCCYTEPDGAVVQEFQMFFTNNRPLHKVALLARFCAAGCTDSRTGVLDTPRFASGPAHFQANSGRGTPMPLEILGLQSQLTTLVFEMPRCWASRVADSMVTQIEIEDCITQRRVRIPQPAEQSRPLHLDELPLLESEGADDQLR
jgi:hypothetical protein